MPDRDECSPARERCQCQFGVDFPVVLSMSCCGTSAMVEADESLVVSRSRAERRDDCP
jgi:hypothetical protein